MVDRIKIDVAKLRKNSVVLQEEVYWKQVLAFWRVNRTLTLEPTKDKLDTVIRSYQGKKEKS